MLTLLLLRHAKASRDQPNLEDFDRPLTARGIEAAPLMGRYIAAHELQPDLILCSSAVRTRQTLDIVRAAFKGAPPDVTFEDDLYMATASNLLGRVKRVPQTCRRVLLVGHNPGLEDLARRLAGSGEAAQLRALAQKFPTAGLAVITFETDNWPEIGPRKGKLRSFVTPRSLKGSKDEG